MGGRCPSLRWQVARWREQGLEVLSSQGKSIPLDLGLFTYEMGLFAHHLVVGRTLWF